MLVRGFANSVNMILKKNVPNLGSVGEIVQVKAGFGRNCLYPLKAAVYATEGNKEKLKESIEKAKSSTERTQTDGQDALKRSMIRAIMGREFKMYVKPNAEVSIGKTEVRSLLENGRHVMLGEARVLMKEKITQCGWYRVPICLDDVTEETMLALENDAPNMEINIVTGDENQLEDYMVEMREEAAKMLPEMEETKSKRRQKGKYANKAKKKKKSKEKQGIQVRDYAFAGEDEVKYDAFALLHVLEK